MARSVKPWVGKNDDSSVPPRVRLRVLDAKSRKCHGCGREVRRGERWTCEHLVALINWSPTVEQPHGNRESNLGVTCCNCLPAKNATDVAEKSAVYHVRRKDAGIKSRTSRPMMGTIASGWKRKMDGTAHRR